MCLPRLTQILLLSLFNMQLGFWHCVQYSLLAEALGLLEGFIYFQLCYGNDNSLKGVFGFFCHYMRCVHKSLLGFACIWCLIQW